MIKDVTPPFTSKTPAAPHDEPSRIAAFPNREEKREGVTYAQAMAMFERFCSAEHNQAVPTIAHEMRIPYDICCKVITGQIWPAAYRFWTDRVWA